MIVRIKSSATEYYDKDKNEISKVDKVIYEKEENIEKISGGEFINTDSPSYKVSLSTLQVVLKDGRKIDDIKDISYIINPAIIEHASVSVNQHTDISNLSSVLNKLDKTLNKLLDK